MFLVYSNTFHSLSNLKEKKSGTEILLKKGKLGLQEGYSVIYLLTSIKG